MTGFISLEKLDLIADVDLKTSCAKFNFNNPSTLLLNTLLFSEPAVVRNPLREEGILQFALCPYLLRTGNTGGYFEHPHGIQLPSPEQM